MDQAIQSFVLAVDEHHAVEKGLPFAQLLSVLYQLQEEKPKQFANQHSSYCQLITMHSGEVTLHDRCQLIDLVLLSLEQYSSVFKKNLQRFEQAFNLVFGTLTGISHEMPASWVHTLEDSDQYDEDDEVVSTCREFIDRMACLLGPQNFLDRFQNSLLTLFENDDWRFKAGVLVTVSQVGLDLQNLNALSFVNTFIAKGASHEHPKVRLSAADALDQLSRDLRPKYQEAYFDSMFPIIVNALGDPVGRVASRWLGCLADFLEDCGGHEKVEPHMDHLMHHIAHHIQHGATPAKHDALQALSVMGSLPGCFDQESLKKPMEIIRMLFLTFHENPAFSQLLGEAADCLSTFMLRQAKTATKPYLPFALETLKNLEPKIENYFFFSAWERMCCSGEKFEGWQDLYLLLFEKLRLPDPQDEAMGIKAVTRTAALFKEDFLPFAGSCLQKLTECIDQSPDDFLAMQGITAKSTVLSACKSASPEWHREVVNCLSSYVDKVDHFLDCFAYEVVETLLAEIGSLAENSADTFSEDELLELGQVFAKFIEKVNGKLQEAASTVEEDSADQDQASLVLVKERIPELFKPILKHLKMPENRRKIIEFQMHQAAQTLEPCKEKDLKYALYCLGNLIEALPYLDLADQWASIYGYLKKYSAHGDCRVRNAAIWAYGICTTKSPKHLLSMEFVKEVLSTAEAAYKLPQLDQGLEDFEHCRDNCVAVVGLVLREFIGIYEVDYLIQGWLQCLPLRHDQVEGRGQMQILMGLVVGGRVTKNKQAICQVLRVYAEFIELSAKARSRENTKTLGQLRQNIKLMIQMPEFKAAGVEDCLPPKCIGSLKGLLSGKYV